MSKEASRACTEEDGYPSAMQDASKAVLPATGSTELRMCRVCFANEGDEGGEQGELIAPCSCTGSVKYIHRGCLYGWLALLHAQGLHQKAKRCEICHAPWNPALVPDGSDGPGSGQGWQVPSTGGDQSAGPTAGTDSWPRTLQGRLRRAWCGIQAAVRTQPWPVLLFRLWRLYAITSGVASAVKGGASGLRGGARFGRILVEEQGIAAVYMLAAVAKLFCTPVAEVLMIQVAAMVVYSMAQAFLYSIALGGLLGSAFGFIHGYATALCNCALVATGTVAKVVGMGKQLARHGWKFFSSLSAAALAALRRSGAVRAFTLNLL